MLLRCEYLDEMILINTNRLNTKDSPESDLFLRGTPWGRGRGKTVTAAPSAKIHAVRAMVTEGLNRD
jgi:hypothetical protein